MQRIAWSPLGMGIINPQTLLTRQAALTDFANRQGVVSDIGQNEQYYYGQEQAARIEQHRQIQANIFKQLDAVADQTNVNLQASITRSVNNIRTRTDLAQRAFEEADRPKTLDPQLYAHLVERARGGDTSAAARLDRLSDADKDGLARQMVREMGAEPDVYDPLSLKTSPSPEYDEARAAVIQTQRAIASMTGGVAPTEGDTPESVARIAQLALRADVFVRPGDASAQFLGAINGDGDTALRLLAETDPSRAEALVQDAKDGHVEQARLRTEGQDHLDAAKKEGAAVGALDPRLAGLMQELTDSTDGLQQSLASGSGARAQGFGGGGDGGVAGASFNEQGLLVGADGQPIPHASLPPEQQKMYRTAAFGLVARPMGTQGEELLRGLSILEQFPGMAPVQAEKARLMGGQPFKDFMQRNSLIDPDSAFKQFMQETKLQQHANRKTDREMQERGLKTGAVSRRKEVLNATREARGLPVDGPPNVGVALKGAGKTLGAMLGRRRPKPSVAAPPTEVSDEEANRLITFK